MHFSAHKYYPCCPSPHQLHRQWNPAHPQSHVQQTAHKTSPVCSLLKERVLHPSEKHIEIIWVNFLYRQKISMVLFGIKALHVMNVNNAVTVFTHIAWLLENKHARVWLLIWSLYNQITRDVLFCRTFFLIHCTLFFSCRG